MNTTALRYVLSLCSTLVFLLGVSAIAFGCSLVQLPERPRSVVSPGMYILVGEVIGYSEPISDPENFRGTAVGIRLRPIESIQFPHYQNDYVEVFIFGNDPDCVRVARDDRPPIGTRYRLALFPARLVASMSGSHVRLESNVFGRIAPDESMFGFSTTKDSVFDYKKDLKNLAKKFRSPEMVNDRGWLSDFLYIETSKDLLRFQRAATKEERIKLLERLLYCPDINYRRLVFSKLGEPLRFEENDPTLLLPGPVKLPQSKGQRRLAKAERQLLAERERMEKSGELNIWQ